MYGEVQIPVESYQRLKKLVKQVNFMKVIIKNQAIQILLSNTLREDVNVE